MSFIDSFNVPLNEFHVNKISEIDTFDYSDTIKKVNHDLGGVSNDFLAQGVENLKRYYAVALLDPNNEHAVSAAVDPFWHSHILHTKDYFKFTDNIFNQYIHHKPLDKNDTEELLKVVELYDYTLNIYKKIFKSVSPKWWPENNHKNIRLGPGVCRHLFVRDEVIRNNSLFDVRKGILPIENITPKH